MPINAIKFSRYYYEFIDIKEYSLAFKSIQMTSMRLESKHKSLKGLLETSSNHQNIPFSIATKHQEQLTLKKNTYVDELKIGTQTMLTESDLAKYDLLTVFKDFKCGKTLWVEYNGSRYNKNILIISDKSLMEIRDIFLINNEIHFVCIVYEVLHFDNFFNSFKIHCKDLSSFKLVDFNSLANKNPFEKKQIINDIYILDETLDLTVIFKDLL